ncbi:DUF3050 domain-containing protein [Paenimyroides ummariense]
MIKVCGTDAVKWNEAAQTAVTSLEKRIRLWEAIEELIGKNNN